MKLKSVFIFITIFFPILIPAQEIPDGYNAISNLQQQVWMNKRLETPYTGYENVKGTPLLFEEFHKGDFYFNNKTCITDKLINYNCYTDDVMFSEENVIYTANSQDIDYFRITGSSDDVKLLFRQVFLSSEKKRIFMQVLYQEKSVLFKRYRKEFLKADIGQPYGQNRQVDEYNDYHEYYVMLNGQEPVILKPRKSSVVQIFYYEPDLMKDFIKKENINLKDEEDLIRLIEYYDNI